MVPTSTSSMVSSSGKRRVRGTPDRGWSTGSGRSPATPAQHGRTSSSSPRMAKRSPVIPTTLPLVDAIGREDLYFEGDRSQHREGIAVAEADLRRFQERGKPVFLIEYGKKPKTVSDVSRRAREQGYRALITVRPLNRLIISP